mmetsp:Transcript_32485/g.90962  ORF Transcript_32485/g.90962 Transcript_32485/m.90962 type:complete len:339 (-) Transcript_32485:253-1269(-)|eukprot:CAMPEP_0119151306 /NCGR_PEP_ID=MMETSP1310-20130426/46145_1 /TAXON_ID=464262 /ORGANISM="Genus nov. species nov., Strain RCC2339" /LENGTH=338 /DNA_ID=CAMNT_0007143573 /DNA_START=308 /DNA_END=1324 /DNA_ORIENTATION=+
MSIVGLMLWACIVALVVVGVASLAWGQEGQLGWSRWGRAVWVLVKGEWKSPGARALWQVLSRGARVTHLPTGVRCYTAFTLRLWGIHGHSSDPAGPTMPFDVGFFPPALLARALRDQSAGSFRVGEAEYTIRENRDGVRRINFRGAVLGEIREGAVETPPGGGEAVLRPWEKGQPTQWVDSTGGLFVRRRGLGLLAHYTDILRDDLPAQLTEQREVFQRRLARLHDCLRNSDAVVLWIQDDHGHTVSFDGEVQYSYAAAGQFQALLQTLRECYSTAPVALTFITDSEWQAGADRPDEYVRPLSTMDAYTLLARLAACYYRIVGYAACRRNQPKFAPCL